MLNMAAEASTCNTIAGFTKNSRNFSAVRRLSGVREQPFLIIEIIGLFRDSRRFKALLTRVLARRVN
jgi:hypothetical protein